MITDPKIDQMVKQFTHVVKTYTPKLPGKFQRLLPFKEGIVVLKQKGATFNEIAGMLRKVGLPASHVSVGRFYAEIVEGRIKSPKPAQPSGVDTTPPTSETRTEPGTFATQTGQDASVA